MKKMGPIIQDREKSRIQFRVFAYNRNKVSLCIKKENGEEQVMEMEREDGHVFSRVVEGSGLNLLYKFGLDEDGFFPDPYSAYQPHGVHGFSRVIDHESYDWQDGSWKGIDLSRAVIYELHVGTFSPGGTFRAATERLDYLLELGINTIELMPVTQNPGRWNWGYDGANLFSVTCNYGKPDDLRYLVDTCHRKGMAVIVDVVYNHFGPEGTYLSVYGPYFTEKHQTPWGAALNYDDEHCEILREMVLENVRHWAENYHVDALRLDAVHAIIDESDVHILEEITGTAGELSRSTGRKLAIIAETDENNVKLINPAEKGGFGIDGQWMDDLHHSIHCLLTGEHEGYYKDYQDINCIEKAFKNYVYTGEYSLFWKKNRGTDASGNPGHRFIVALQTHDQVGNRAMGERLSALVPFPFLKTAAGILFMAPYIPMLFMGEEYAEEKPFLFFTDYIDPELKKAVSEGRKNEFHDFKWGDFPDPEDDRTYFRSILTPREEWKPHQHLIFAFYRDLIGLRKEHPVLKVPEKTNLNINMDGETRRLIISRWGCGPTVTGLFNLGEQAHPVESFPGVSAAGKQIFNSEWKQYGGEEEGETSRLKCGQMILVETQD